MLFSVSLIPKYIPSYDSTIYTLLRRMMKTLILRPDQTTINERKAFFDWLSPSIDADKDHEIILGKRYLQTGEWVLRRDQFQQWYRSGSSQLLWCWGARMYLTVPSTLKGKANFIQAGAGKSVLA